MTSPEIRSDCSNFSISTMISTSCVMLENLQESNTSLNECEYFPDVAQRSAEEVLQASVNVRESDHVGIMFESEATPFSHDAYFYSTGPSEERSHCEYGTSVLTQPWSTYNDYVVNINNKALFISPEIVESSVNINNKDHSSSKHENAMQSGYVYSNLKDEIKKPYDDRDYRFETAHSSKSAVSFSNISKGQCSHWNSTEGSRDYDFSASVRHEAQSFDWPVLNQSTSTLEPHPIREGSLELNVSFGAVYEDVNQTGWTSSFPLDENHSSSRFHSIQNQENKNDVHEWSQNSSSENHIDPSVTLGATSKTCIMKSNECVYLGNDSAAISKTSNLTINSPESECEAVSDFENVKFSVDRDMQKALANSSFSVESSAALSSPLVSNPNVFFHRHEGNEGYRRNGYCNTRPPESLHEKLSDFSHYPISPTNTDAGENNVSESMRELDNDSDCTGCKKQSHAALRQKQTTGTIESIQHELELLEERRKKMNVSANSIQQQLENYRLKTMAKDEKPSLVDVDYMICSGVTVAGFKPRAIIRKRSKVNMPLDIKDQGYWQKRRKNNDSARKSRELKKEKEKNFYRRALELEYENIYLHECLSLAEAELAAVGRRITAPPMSSVGLY